MTERDAARDACVYVPMPDTPVDLSGPTNQAMLAADHWERRALDAEAEVIAWMSAYDDQVEQKEAAEAALAKMRAAVEAVASCPGWINSNALAWQKCRPENQWLDDDPSRCYHGRLVADCEKQCPARIAFASLAASQQPTEGE